MDAKRVRVRKVRDVEGFYVLNDQRESIDEVDVLESELPKWRHRGWDVAPAKRVTVEKVKE